MDQNQKANQPAVIKGPCCVCKDTRAELGTCMMTYSPEKCEQILARHNKCLKGYGFSPAAV